MKKQKLHTKKEGKTLKEWYGKTEVKLSAQDKLDATNFAQKLAQVMRIE